MNKIFMACLIFSISSNLLADEIIVNSNENNNSEYTTPAYSVTQVPSAPGTVTTEIGPNSYFQPYQVPAANNARSGSMITGGAIAAPSRSIPAPSRSIEVRSR